MQARKHVCSMCVGYVCMYVCTVFMYLCIYWYVCMYVCMYVQYVCMYVCIDLLARRPNHSLLKGKDS
jgi:hypothetical protein